MTNAQIWFVLISSAVLIFLAIIMFADAVKGAPPAKDSKALASTADPWDLDRLRGPGD